MTRPTATFKMLLFVAVALIACLPTETLATSRLAQAEECKDHTHFNCHHIADDGDCDGVADKGEVIGDTYCPVSCGRCKAESDEIYTDQTCYSFGKQEIHTKFANSQPDQEDWVGIYPSDANPNELGSPVAWYWLCGSKKDKCKTGVGTVTFPWLPPGKYRALMSRHHSTKVHGAPYTSYAQSEVFEVVRGSSCAARRRTEEASSNNNNNSKNSLRGS